MENNINTTCGTIKLDRSDLIIVTENADNDIYIVESKYILDLLDDWNGECKYVPANDARVFFAAWNGSPLNPHDYTDFGSLCKLLSRKVYR